MVVGTTVQIAIDQIIGRLVDLHPDRVLHFRALLQAGSAAPPIELTLIGMTSIGVRYIVRDGHHRLAAAQAEGNATITARIDG